MDWRPWLSAVSLYHGPSSTVSCDLYTCPRAEKTETSPSIALSLWCAMPGVTVRANLLALLRFWFLQRRNGWSEVRCCSSLFWVSFHGTFSVV